MDVPVKENAFLTRTLFRFLPGSKRAEAARNICVVCMDGFITERTALLNLKLGANLGFTSYRLIVRGLLRSVIHS